MLLAFHVGRKALDNTEGRYLRALPTVRKVLNCVKTMLVSGTEVGTKKIRKLDRTKGRRDALWYLNRW